MENIIIYLLYFILFISAQAFSIFGQFIFIPYGNLSLWESYKMAIPFGWIAWAFMVLSVYISDKYNLTTNGENIFLIIISQYIIFSLINKYYLKETETTSDNIGFLFIFIGFCISYFNIISSIINDPNKDDKNPNDYLNFKQLY